MGFLKQRRKRMGYETDVPRCENCVSFQKPYIYLTTHSQTKRSQPLCKVGEFTVSPQACCDQWESPRGEKLETA